MPNNLDRDGAGVGSPAQPLSVDQLYKSADASTFSFRTTAELEDVEGLIGQDRALEAVRFGSRIDQHGFNLFVLGPPGSGKHEAVGAYLREKAASEPTPADWVYVNNFDTPYRPIAISLPSREGFTFRDGMQRLIDDLQSSIPVLFESEEYQSRRRAIDEGFREDQEAAFSGLKQKAAAHNIAVIRTPMGFAMAPTQDGKVIEPEIFNRIEAAKREEIEKLIQEFQKELEQILQHIPRWDKERRDKTRELNREIGEVAVRQGLAELEGHFKETPAVLDYLKAVRNDLIANVAMFVAPIVMQAAGQEIQAAGPEQQLPSIDGMLKRYQVNLLVSHVDENCDGSGAPVIFEDHPTMSNLVGRVEQIAQMGALVTDFNLIKPGMLHRANGGYLLLDARRVLTEPVAWEALKRSLQGNVVKIESPSQFANLVSTVTLEPDPIPLKVKVVLFGDRQLYYMLSAMDPDFSDLFKVAADFNDWVDRTDDHQTLIARTVGTVCRRDDLRHVSAGGVARVLEHAARLADDGERLSTRVGPISDVLSEADFWAAEAGHELIEREDVDRTIREQVRRLDRMRELSHETITRNTILIDTDGEAVGQINGLSVLSLGNFAFGKPTRITANVRMGTGRVIDIEREVDLGGPLHSKGVLILSSYLADRFAPSVPLSLSASLVFEQSYGGVDGDSASSTELYALLSALSGIPIKQGFAVTGSVNQKGQVQAIGGVNEKIEGFYDVCQERGLTERQGVLIPVANVKNLMLRRDIVQSCEDGRFAIYPIATIDQGIELLTGVSSGARDEHGAFPQGTISHAVEARLIAFAEARKRFGDSKDGGKSEETAL